MSDATSSSKRPIQKGDIVVAPFVGLNDKGDVFYKSRPAYVADVTNGNATVVYMSSSPADISQRRYAGELDPIADGFGKGSFYDAGKTNVISTDFLHHDNYGKKLSETTRESIERSIVQERRDHMEARQFVKETRTAATNATTPQVAAQKTQQADTLAAKNSLGHQHFAVKPNGDVQHLTLEHGAREVGRGPKEMLEKMERLAPQRFPKQEAAPTHAPAVAKPSSAPPEGFTKVVGENGREVMLLGGKKEALRQAVEGELVKAGHSGELTADSARKIAVAAATARDGDRLAVTPDGAHKLLTAAEKAPEGATVVDASAFRQSAKIAEAAVLRDLQPGEPAKAPIGEVVTPLGKDAPAVQAAAKAQELLEPMMQKAAQATAELGERAGGAAAVADGVAKVSEAVKEVGNAAEPGISPAASAPGATPELQQGAHNPTGGPAGTAPSHAQNDMGVEIASTIVRDLVAREMRASGQPDFQLTAAESKAIAQELRNAGPGDQLVVEPKGDIYLMFGQGGTTPEAPRGAVVLDADAIRDNAGISRSTEAQKSMEQQQTAKAEAKREEPSQRAERSEMSSTM